MRPRGGPWAGLTILLASFALGLVGVPVAWWLLKHMPISVVVVIITSLGVVLIGVVLVRWRSNTVGRVDLLLAIFSARLGRDQWALDRLDRATRQLDRSHAGGGREAAAEARLYRYAVLKRNGRLKEALRALDSVADDFAARPDRSLEEIVARVLSAQYVTLMELGRPAEAMAKARRLISLLDESNNPRVQILVARAMLGLGTAMTETGQVEAGLRLLRETGERLGRSSVREERVIAAKCLYSRGLALAREDRRLEAVDQYDVVAARFDEERSADLRDVVANALYARALSLGMLRQTDRCRAGLDELLRLHGPSSRHPIPLIAAKAMAALAASLRDEGRDVEAAQMVAMLSRAYGASRDADVRDVVAEAAR